MTVPITSLPIRLKDILLATMEDEAEKLKDALSKYTGCEHVFLTDSGISALHLLFKAYGVDRGSRVGLPAYVCEKLVRFVIDYGCRPRLFDVDHSYNISPDRMEKVDVLIAVHMFGNPCEIDELRDFSKVIIEDSAQCIGAKYKDRSVGSLGDSSFFSFGMGKPITAMGGGAIATNDDRIARMLRNSNSKGGRSKVFKALSYWLVTKRWMYRMMKGRMDRLRKERRNKLKERCSFEPRGICKYQASLGARMIERLEDFNRKRIKNYEEIRKGLMKSKGVMLPKVSKDASPIFLRLPVYMENDHFRSAVERFLLSGGIETTKPYEYVPEFFGMNGEYPIARKLVMGTITLPTHPSLTSKDINTIIEVFRRLG